MQKHLVSAQLQIPGVFGLPVRVQLGQERQGCENLMGDSLILIYVGGFSQLLSQLLTAFKMPQKVSPVLFQTEHGVAGTAEGFCVLGSAAR